MDTQTLRPLLQATPFTPLRIHVKDGRAFDVFYPNLVKMGPWGIFIFTPGEIEPQYTYKTYEVFPLSDVLSAEPLGSVTA